MGHKEDDVIHGKLCRGKHPARPAFRITLIAYISRNKHTHKTITRMESESQRYMTVSKHSSRLADAAQAWRIVVDMARTCNLP